MNHLGCRNTIKAGAFVDIPACLNAVAVGEWGKETDPVGFGDNLIGLNEAVLVH